MLVTLTEIRITHYMLTFIWKDVFVHVCLYPILQLSM
jgi:hypothetical protein